jgi:hypothetical protein
LKEILDDSNFTDSVIGSRAKRKPPRGKT